MNATPDIVTMISNILLVISGLILTLLTAAMLLVMVLAGTTATHPQKAKEQDGHTEQTDELELCPFCGYEPVLESFPVRKGFEATITCNDCGACIQTVTCDTEEQAIADAKKKWNRRVGNRPDAQ